MLYTKIQSQSVLVLVKKIFKCFFFVFFFFFFVLFCFFNIYVHGGHLFQWCGTSGQSNCQQPFDRSLHVKSGENWSSGFREEDV